MSDLYDVKALVKDGLDLVLEIQLVARDAIAVPENPAFALIVIHEAKDEGAKKNAPPLHAEASLEDLVDGVWMRKYAKGFVESVKILDVKKESTRVSIRVTDAAWTAHIEAGATWSSRAYPVVESFDECAPIHVDEANDGVGEIEGAFVWVPRECFVDPSIVAFEKLPPLLEMPAYPITAYSVTEKMSKKKLDAERLESWRGRAVFIKGALWQGTFGYVEKPGWVKQLHLGVGSSGAGTREIESIGLLVPNARRRGTKLGYDRVLAATATTVVAAKKTGSVLELTLRVPPDQRKLPIASASDLMALIVDPLIDRSKFFDPPLVASKLTTALDEELEARGFGGDYDSRLEQIYPEIAHRFVASFEIDPPKNGAPIPFDDLSHRDVHEALSKPWPTATLRVTVTNPDWIDHFPNEIRTPIALRDKPLPAAATS